MTAELRFDSRPTLERPVMIAAFRGWNDGGQGASLAGALPRARLGCAGVRVDRPETSTTSRRRGRLCRSSTVTRRKIEWPENQFLHAPLPGAGRDAIILLGVEPNLRWRTFAGLITGVAREFQASSS